MGRLLCSWVFGIFVCQTSAASWADQCSCSTVCGSGSVVYAFIFRMMTLRLRVSSLMWRHVTAIESSSSRPKSHIAPLCASCRKSAVCATRWACTMVQLSCNTMPKQRPGVLCYG
eukprot:2063239-Amphidinium_carterae.3